LSWCLLARLLGDSLECTCVAVDLRGHGDTETSDDYLVSIDTLSNDVCEVVKKWNKDNKKVIIVGHSLGGSVAVHTALKLSEFYEILGMVVIDVVEGTALESLRSMRTILQGRPTIFKSVEKATEWSVKTGYIRNLHSARASMVGQLAKKKENPNKINKSFNDGYKWRIDLMKTEPHWKGWFEGLSSKFLSISSPKLLLLAGVDRLDKELMVGQMQGKFQMKVLPRAGHAIHEDAPERVADALQEFFLRHKMLTKMEENVAV